MHAWSRCWIDPPVGTKCWQDRWATWNWDVVTPNDCASPFGRLPLLSGSGKFGTPWARMQAEYATADAEVDDPPAPVGDPLPLHAAASSARTAVRITVIA